MTFLFACLWCLVLVFFETVFQVRVWNFAFNLQGLFLLVVFMGFRYRLLAGILGAAFAGWLMETFMAVPHGLVMGVHILVFAGIQAMISHIYVESYLTKSLWVGPLSIGYQYLMGWVAGWPDSLLFARSFLFQAFLQSCINVLFSLPLFMILDFLFEYVNFLGTRKQGALTGADLFQSKSGQRKYL
jgi:hypothetical protein